MLAAPAFYVPHDAVVPGVLTIGDVADLAGALAPLPLRIETVVDGRNRRVGQEDLLQAFAPARRAYEPSGDRLILEPAASADAVAWLLKAVSKTPPASPASATQASAPPGELDVFTTPASATPPGGCCHSSLKTAWTGHGATPSGAGRAQDPG